MDTTARRNTPRSLSVDLIRAYLEDGAPGWDAPDEARYTPLRWASIRNQVEVAGLLAQAGADPNTVGADGGTPLHGAAHRDHAVMMGALLRAGGDVTVQNQWGRTPLRVAARRGCQEVARLLLDAGADPNATTVEGWSTLNVAYRAGHPELVELLLESDADPELADSEGLLPGDGPAGMWIASRHSRAFHTLSSDRSFALATSREEYAHITNPGEDQHCLMCHRTAAQNPHAVFAESYSPAQGVCHGHGSAYINPEIMGDREAFLARAGRIPDELTCRECHRDERFDFLTMWERIRHEG